MPNATVSDFKKHHASQVAKKKAAAGRARTAAQAKRNAARRAKAKKKPATRVFDLRRQPAPTPKDDGPNPFK